MTRTPAKAWVVAVAISVFAHAAILGALALIAHHLLAPAIAPSTTPTPKHGPVMRVSVRSATHPAMGRPLEGAAPTASPHLPSQSRPTEHPAAPTSASTPEPAPTEPVASGEVGPEVPSEGASASSGERMPGEADGTASGSTSGAGGTGNGGTENGTGATTGHGSQVNAEVHARLASAAAGCYPAAARRFRQRGTVTVAFCVAENLAGSAPEVRQSSGLGLLDAASACVVDHAAPFPAEAALQCFTVPIRFGQ